MVTLINEYRTRDLGELAKGRLKGQLSGITLKGLDQNVVLPMHSDYDSSAPPSRSASNFSIEYDDEESGAVDGHFDYEREGISGGGGGGGGRGGARAAKDAAGTDCYTDVGNTDRLAPAPAASGGCAFKARTAARKNSGDYGFKDGDVEVGASGAHTGAGGESPNTMLTRSPSSIWADADQDMDQKMARRMIDKGLL